MSGPGVDNEVAGYVDWRIEPEVAAGETPLAHGCAVDSETVDPGLTVE